MSVRAEHFFLCSMTPHSQRSPFLHLPPEVRNHIYQYALSGEVFDIHCWRRYTPFGFATRVLRKQKNFLALLAVCRQLHTETRLLPFQLNAFCLKSQDAFGSWLDKFSADERESIQEVHIVTWMARHMIEGEAWKSKPLDTVFPVHELAGLKRVEIEVRTNGRVRDCAKASCLACEEYGDGLNEEEQKLRKWLMSCNRELSVDFKLVMA